MKNKDKAVTVLTKGVEFLFKKNKVSYLKGFGSFVSDKKIKVKSSDGKETEIEGENIIIATGSEPSQMPNNFFGLWVDAASINVVFQTYSGLGLV